MKINTAPISGAQELLPTDQVIFDRLKANLAKVYQSYGFLNIETPIIERTEILLAKAGGDTEKQIYMVSKTAESADSADQALRFDHTVPLARYVAEHQQSLTFPFHATQINRNFRGERAQRGRFREFYQCDIDIIGRESLPIAYDAKVIACLYDALKTFNLPPLTIRISNRKVLAGFLASLDLTAKLPEISNIIDHAEKVSPEKTTESLKALDLNPDQVAKITTFMHIKGSYATVESALSDLIGNDLSPIKEGLAELKTVFEILSKKPNISDIEIDFLIIRGLDYYTGTVFETFLKDYRDIGSIASGGRYENLTKNFTNHSFPGVGGSIGLTRLFYVLNEAQLLDKTTTLPLDYVLLPLSENEYATALDLAAKLRDQGKIVDLDFDDRKLGARLTRAAKLSKNAIIIGDTEAKTNSFQVKNLQTGETAPLAIN